MAFCYEICRSKGTYKLIEVEGTIEKRDHNAFFKKRLPNGELYWRVIALSNKEGTLHNDKVWFEERNRIDATKILIENKEKAIDRELKLFEKHIESFKEFKEGFLHELENISTST